MRTELLLSTLIACGGPSHETAAPEETGVPSPSGEILFSFPVDPRSAIDAVVGVDHDPEVQSSSLGSLLCTAYDGSAFPACYDEHDGSDFMLAGGFDAMDAGSAAVLAAADGVVVSTEDGHYDRCHADVSEEDGVSCDGHEGIANHVILEHEGGVRSLYWHLMQDSVIVEIGQELRCGERLGTIGSSGYSSAPHLHFEVQDASGQVVDPYAGEWSQPESWWGEQEAGDGLPAKTCGDD